MACELPDQQELEPPLKRTEQKVDPGSAGDEEQHLGERHGVRSVYTRLPLLPPSRHVEILSSHVADDEAAVGRPLSFTPDVRRQEPLGLQSPERASGLQAAVREPGDALHRFAIDGHRHGELDAISDVLDAKHML
jgi:hypothetical protein